jgi:hypothetical protein
MTKNVSAQLNIVISLCCLTDVLIKVL